MPKSGGTFTGAVTLNADPTANLGAATKQYVDTQITNKIAASDAMVFKGTIGTGGTATTLPTSAVIGDTYKCISAVSLTAAQSYTGSAVSAKIGDLIVAMSSSKWIVVPSGDETVTTLKYSTTTQSLTTSAQSGAITLGEAATKQVVTSVDTSAKLPTSNAVKTFVEGKGYLTTSNFTTGSVGSASNWSAGSVPTLGTAIAADDITGWNAGSTPTLGTAIPADDITAWDPGATPTLGTAISADDITAWSAGSTPTLGTAISADDITGWTTNTPTTPMSVSVSGCTLTLTSGSEGTSATLNYTARSIPNVTSVGSVPSLSYTARSIPNVTSVGTAPSLSYTARSIPNVTDVGAVPSLSYTARSIPNVTSVGSAPSLTITSTSVVTGLTS